MSHAIENARLIDNDHGGGALRDAFDRDDHYYKPNPLIHLPPAKDLREAHPEGMVPIYYQGAMKACTANAAAAAFWYEQRVGGHATDWGEIGPSRLFIY